MSNFFRRKTRFLTFLFILTIILTSFAFVSCKRAVDYFSYVSELRNNIFLAEAEDISLRIYSVRKESPYAADGVPREVSARTEIYLTAPEGVADCHIHFLVNGERQGGELSYDNVRSEYYLFLTLDTSAFQTLSCQIRYGEKTYDLDAVSVLDGEEISPETILQTVKTESAELFAAMTDKYGFTGEIYIRLIFEDSPYYYVGVIDRNGGICAHLINAKTGKVLAKRQS